MKTRLIDSIRLRYGIRWKGRYPPVARPLFSLLCIGLLYTLASTMDYHVQRGAELEQVQEDRASYRAVVLDCINQAHNTERNVAVVFDNKLIGVDCQVLSTDAYAGTGKRRM